MKRWCSSGGCGSGGDNDGGSGAGKAGEAGEDREGGDGVSAVLTRDWSGASGVQSSCACACA